MRRLTVLLTLVACGDNLSPPLPLLEDDPAVERGCAPAGDDPEPFARAKRVDCDDELPAGILVGGRAGDVLLENDRIQVIIRAGAEGYLYAASPPGAIIDAARRGADDQVKELYPLVDNNVSSATEIALTEAGDDAPATVVVRGTAVPFPYLQATLGTQAAGLMVETQYVLMPGDSSVTVRTMVSPIPGVAGPSEVGIGDLLFFGGAIEMWLPGVGQPSGVAAGPMLASAGSATTSYGIVSPAAGQVQLNDVGVEVLSAGRQPLEEAEPVERVFLVGDGSVSSVTDQGFALLGETLPLGGALDPVDGGQPSPEPADGGQPSIDVAVYAATGEPVTMARAAPDGAFEVAVPPGDYLVFAASPAHEASPNSVAAAAGERSLTIPLGASGLLRIAVTDSLAGTALPARVVLTPVDRPPILLYADGTGVLSVPLPPGPYAIDVSRGVEYDVYSAVDVEVTGGETTEVPVSLERVVDTAGWIAMDPHLHSEMSADSSIPLRERLRAVAGEGIELAISTDHDFLTDYAPVLAALALDDKLATRVGVEVTSRVWGHVNGWPLELAPDRGGRGAFVWFEKSPGEIFDELHAAGDAVVVQVNHPRRSHSFLDAIGFDRETVSSTTDPADLGIPGADLDDFDFDALEVANGKTDPFDETFPDWLALVASGHPAVATGSSDSHRADQYAGSSRTYIYVGAGDDDPATVDLDAVEDALRDRRAVVSQGAFVTGAIEDPATGEPVAPGEMVDLSGEASARLHVRVQAPPWMPVLRILVYAGRELATTIELDPADTAIVRYDEVVELPLESDDSFFVVLVEPAGDAPPVLEALGPSFTNPLLYDRDGDQNWSP